MSRFIALAILVEVGLVGATCRARAQAEKATYPAMAPVGEYLMADENSEIALARKCCSTIHFGPCRSNGAGAEWIHYRSERHERLPLFRGTIIRRFHRTNPNFGTPKFVLPFALIHRPQGALRPIFLMRPAGAGRKSKTEIVEAPHRHSIKRNCPRWSRERCAT